MLPSSSPSFANSHPPFDHIIDTHVREALKSVLHSLSIPLAGHGFYTFRQFGATLAFDNYVFSCTILVMITDKSSG